jgi:hypothetical protein
VCSSRIIDIFPVTKGIVFNILRSVERLCYPSRNSQHHRDIGEIIIVVVMVLL